MNKYGPRDLICGHRTNPDHSSTTLLLNRGTLVIVYNNQVKRMQNMFAGLLGAPTNAETNPTEGLSAGFLDMLDKVVDKVLRFNTAKQTFNKTYPKVDHLQRFFNESAVNHFVEVISNKYNTDKQPVSILDLCCGYGLATLTLRERLINNGVEIAKIVGYDISDDMINFAQAKSTLFSEVEFRKKNVESEFDDVAQFDVVLCMFGLHWMNDLESTIAKIHRSLKPNGIFLSLTPIEIHDLFDMRTAFVSNSRWTDAIAEGARTLHPFHYEKEDYLKPLSKYFTSTYEEKKETKFTYTHNEYRTFLHSWLQEVRHLTNDISHEAKKEAVANAYIDDFIESIPKNLTGNVIIHDNGSVVYTQHTFDFDGKKIEL